MATTSMIRSKDDQRGDGLLAGLRAAEGYGFGKKDHTQAVRLFQAELNTAKLPFLFVQALFRWPTDDPATLRLACSVLRKSGADLRELGRVLG